LKELSIWQLANYDFIFKDISVSYRTPLWSSMGNLTDHNRTVNGFLLIDRGACHYDWIGGSADLSRGGLIYLALGSRKVLHVTEKPFSYYNINFNVYDTADGEQIIFAKDPLVISQNASEKIFDCCRTMLSSTIARSGIFKSTSLLCDLFNTIIKYHSTSDNSKISDAVRYIEDNYTKNFDVSELSDLCYMSQAHFFRLFKKEMGMTPIEYKNKLRIERAKYFLSENECSVTEISDLLGFESVYYFSRFFKKYTGVPPSEYSSFK